MRVYLTFFVVFLVIPERSGNREDEYHRFPEGFKFGAGGSAYQIEGGWNASDKGESVWDRYLHTKPWVVANESNGDVTCDSYHKYKEDVRLVKDLGLDEYRFSISWSRILPNGTASSVSQDGLRYYHNLIDELIANGIEPNVCLYHWDHPQILEDMGGWLNESMIEWFADYADIVYREFGPKVKIFTTINEPKIYCFFAYVHGEFAPGKKSSPAAGFLCGHNSLKAHARAYRLYDSKYRSSQNGKIGFGSVCESYLPKNPNETLAAEIGFEFSCGWLANPIFNGDYPQLVKDKVAQMSRDAGLSESMLPEFSIEWIDYIRGTSDFFGLYHYTSNLVELGIRNSISTGSDDDYLPDLGISKSVDPSWELVDGLAWVAPEGLGHLLREIKNKYNNPPVYILENGIPTLVDNLNDDVRIRCHYSFLEELLLAVHRDGCDVQKYSFWSLLDNFEWIFGYEKRSYGFIRVNFTSPNRERIPKKSASWVKTLMRARKLQPELLPPR